MNEHKIYMLWIKKELTDRKGSNSDGEISECGKQPWNDNVLKLFPRICDCHLISVTHE